MAVIKTRKLKFSRPITDEAEKIKKILSELKGVQQFRVDESGTILSISYDLEWVMLKKIEEELSTLGIQLDNRFGPRMKRGWHHYTEQNELDNLHVHPTCCSDPKEIH